MHFDLRKAPLNPGVQLLQSVTKDQEHGSQDPGFKANVQHKGVICPLLLGTIIIISCLIRNHLQVFLNPHPTWLLNERSEPYDEV